MNKGEWINSYLQRMDMILRRRLSLYGLDAEIRILHRDGLKITEEDRDRYERYLEAIDEDAVLDKIHERSGSWTEEITHYEKLINLLLERYIGGESEDRFIGQITFAGIHPRVPAPAPPQITEEQLQKEWKRSEDRIISAMDRRTDRLSDQMNGLSETVTASAEEILGEIDAAHDSLADELSGVKGSMQRLAAQQAVFAVQLKHIDEELEGRIRDLAEEPEIEELMQRKLEKIMALEKAYPSVSFEDNTRWLLLFIADRVLTEKLPDFLKEISEGSYRGNALAREKDALGRDIYFAKGALGEYGVQKKDGKAVIFHLEPGEEILGNGITMQFLATHPLASGPRIFYNEAIFDEFRRLLKLATRSILIVSPWINLGILGFYQGKEDPTEADYRDHWGGGYYRYLKEAADRNVEIVLKYGICDASGTKSENEDKENRTQRAAEKLRELLGAVVTLDHSNTHIKAVVIDERVCLIGSCNLLSFHSRYRNGEKDSRRHELMMEVRDPGIIRNLAAYIRQSVTDSDALIERKPVGGA